MKRNKRKKKRNIYIENERKKIVIYENNEEINMK